MEHKSKWWAAMLAKYGSEEAVRAKMRANAQLTPKHGRGGFAYLKKHDPAKLKTIRWNQDKRKRG